MNDFRSKNESIKQLIQENGIDILVLTETKVYNKSTTRLDGFQMFPVVRKRSGGGGLLIAMRHGISSSIMVDEVEDAEFATVKMKFGNMYFRLLVVYGPQESDHIDKINQFYENLSLQIERASLTGDPILMVGDFSAKLGKTIIKGDIHDMSNNGQKLHNMIIKYNLHVINSMEICTGIFTRVNNKIIGEKSVLDYVIASDDLLRYIKNMQIDTNKQFTPWRTIKSGKRFSDHNAIMLKLGVTRFHHSPKINERLYGILTTQKVEKGSRKSQVLIVVP